MGATSGLVPVFQAEASPPQFRGIVTGWSGRQSGESILTFEPGSFQLCVTLGIWGSAMSNWGFSQRSGDVSWRVTVGLQLVFAALLFVGFVFSPESPLFLAKKGRWEECRSNLANLRGLHVEDSDIDVEMDEIRIKTEEDKEKGAASYAEVFSTKDRILYRVLIGIFVQVRSHIHDLLQTLVDKRRSDNKSLESTSSSATGFSLLKRRVSQTLVRYPSEIKPVPDWQFCSRFPDHSCIR